MGNYDVITSGYVSMDHIVKIKSPSKIGFTSLVTNKTNSKIYYGGCSVNIAYALCKLGLKSMPILRVGEDYEELGFKKFLEEGNVPIEGIQKLKMKQHLLVIYYRIIIMIILQYFIQEQWMENIQRI